MLRFLMGMVSAFQDKKILEICNIIMCLYLTLNCIVRNKKSPRNNNDWKYVQLGRKMFFVCQDQVYRLALSILNLCTNKLVILGSCELIYCQGC